MSRQMAVKVTAGTAVAGALAFGLAIPAQAASSPAPAPKTSSTPAKRAVVTTAQLNAGTKLRLGDTGDAVTDVQNRLNTLGIITPVTGVYNATTATNVARFNEKFRGYEEGANKVVDAKTWAKLKSATAKGDRVPSVCKTKAAALCISKSQRIVRYYRKGQLVTALDARFGGPGNRTRNGNFRIFRKVKNDFSSQYKTPMPWSMYFSGGQAVHYSMFFNAVGYNGASHGCVNIRNKKGEIALWKKVKIGTFAKVYG